jgi:hypothetical protein
MKALVQTQEIDIKRETQHRYKPGDIAIFGLALEGIWSNEVGRA